MQIATQNITVPKLRFKDEHGNNYPDWEEKRLVEFKNLEHGDGDWILSKDISKEGEYKIVQLGNIGFGLYINKDLKTISMDKFKEIKGTMIKKGDLLINRMVDNNINACLFDYDGNYITSVDVCWIRNNKYFDNYFIMSLMLCRINQKRLLSLSSGSGRVRISKKNLFEKFSFMLPSIKEQEKIASFLSSVDDRVQKLERKKSLLEEYKKGVMQKIFSQELRFKDTNGEDYPNWELSKLKELVSTPISDGPHLTPKFIKEGIPFLSVNNIVDSKIDFKNTRTISHENHIEFSKKCKPVKNDLLLGKAASVGKIAIVETDIEFNIWSPLAMIRIKEIFVSKYFYYCFQTQTLQKRIKRFINSSSQGNIGMGDIGKLIFEFPQSRKEQQKIASFLSGIDKKIELVETQIQQSKTFKKGLLQQMFV